MEVDQDGILEWAFCGDIGDSEPYQASPIRFMIVHGDPSLFNTDLNRDLVAELDNTKPLNSLDHSNFEAHSGEDLGVSGLFRSVSLLPSGLGWVSELQPQDVLLVGAMGYSLNQLLSAMHHFGWDNTRVTVVDKSVIPLRVLNRLGELGYWSWPGGVELVHSNIVDYHDRAVDLVFMDIVSASAVRRSDYSHRRKLSPWINYQAILGNCKSLVKPGGRFFSRTLCHLRLPESGKNHNPGTNQQILNERKQVLLSQLGHTLYDQLNKTIVDSIVRVLWPGPEPVSYCGLALISQHEYFRHSNPTAIETGGPENFRCLYDSILPGCEEVRVFSKPQGWLLQTFGWQKDY